jgi:hypothetical protein
MNSRQLHGENENTSWCGRGVAAYLRRFLDRFVAEMKSPLEWLPNGDFSDRHGARLLDSLAGLCLDAYLRVFSHPPFADGISGVDCLQAIEGGAFLAGIII